MVGLLSLVILKQIITRLHIADDVAEYVTNNRAKQQENSDNDNGDQHQNKRILYQALTFFTWEE